MVNGYAIIKHQVFREISDEEVLRFLPQEVSIPKYRIFDIKQEIVDLDAIHQLNSFEYKIYQKRVVENEIKPFLEKNPDFKVLYFGTATIPLALHLGFCFGSWRDIDVYLLNREKVTWNWPESADSADLPFITDFIKEDFPAPIDVGYKVEVTYATHSKELEEVMANYHKIIGLRLETIGKDVFKSSEQLKSFAHQFSLGIDSIANHLPNADKIHLFPTVPIGLAFLMGTRINPNITKQIVTYQYNTNQSPKYEQVLILQEPNQTEVNISETDQKFINEIKVELRSEIAEKVSVFASRMIEQREKETSKSTWIQLILPKGDYTEMERGLWKSIPDMPLSVLKTSSLSPETNLAADGFHISENNEWQINNRFVFNISRRLGNNKGKILRALRLFIFHETLHIYQSLTNYTAEGIGRFPRILEEADYVADVWAMLHEFSFSKMYYASDASSPKEFFKEMIETAIETMWAFDDLDPNYSEMQIRRVNRYLIWYWNYLQIEDRNCQTLQDIVNILSNKPLLEIKGLDIRGQSQRTIYRLTNPKPDMLELGYLDQQNGKIYRLSNSGGLRIDEMINGFKERDGVKISTQLKSFHHQTRE